MTAEHAAGQTEPSGLKARLSGWWSAFRAQGPVRRWELAGYGGLLLAAAVMRLWDLGSRALHHDESLHAYYSWNLSRGVGYEHLPMMHGPFQFEVNAAVFRVLGDGDYTARLLYALLGIALVALPFFFRGRLGRPGALLVSAMLAFSPVMLYFSRFARNDILMAAWTLGLVIVMWRYLDEGKNRYLYIGSALLALAFATKETAYIVTFILGLYLLLRVVSEAWSWEGRSAIVGKASPPVAIMHVVSETGSAIRRAVKQSRISRPASFLALMATLTLPQWSAAVSVFQDTPLLSWSNLVLASPVGSPHIGAPSGGGLVIAFLVVILLLGVSAYWGFKWNWSVWWRSAAIFYGVWVLLYTTFFTNIVGFGSGIWTSLGYWWVQQGEGRGGQPWYYYFVITSIYEFLPLLFGVIAAVYYLRRRDAFGHFLVYWAVVTFIMYTVASEKMPWLLVNVALPLIVLSGKFLADVVQSVQWRRLAPGGGMLILAGVPALLALSWRLAFFKAEGSDAANVLVPLGLGAGLLGVAALGVYLARRIGVRNLAAFATVPVALVLLALTIRAGSRATYENGDVPVEMLVYTQTSPDIPRLVREIERGAEATGQQVDVPISVDETSGFTWPWAWYLRDYTRVGFPSYGSAPPSEATDSSVVLVHSRNQAVADPALKDLYTEGERIKHRWWFPEYSTYKGLTLGKFLRAFGDRDAWRGAMDYFLYREGVEDRVGSEDAYIYFSKGFPQSFSPSE